MLERLTGNDALKRELGTALHSGRLPHAVLLVGEPGCGAGFAARCLAADYLYPAGGPHAEAVLKGEDTECLVLRGEGRQRADPRQKGPRGPRGDPALGAVHRCGGPCAVHLRCANLNGTQNRLPMRCSRSLRSRPRGAVLLTAPSAAVVLPTIRSRCAAYTIAPVPVADCAAHLRAERLPAAVAGELAFLYEGHIGTAPKAGTTRRQRRRWAWQKRCAAMRRRGYLPGAGAADKVRARQGGHCRAAVAVGPAVQCGAAPPRLRAGAVRRPDARGVPLRSCGPMPGARRSLQGKRQPAVECRRAGGELT